MITAGFAFNVAARYRGVKPRSARVLGSAPASTSAVITAGFAFDVAARCRGVKPPSVRTLRSASASRSAVHRSVQCSYPLNLQQAVSSSRQTISLSLADHTIPVSVSHKGVCRMVVLHGCDAVTPRLGACNPSIPIVVPQT